MLKTESRDFFFHWNKDFYRLVGFIIKARGKYDITTQNVLYNINSENGRKNLVKYEFVSLSLIGFPMSI